MQVDFAMIERARSAVAPLNRKARIPDQNPIARRNQDPFRESENNGSPLIHPQISVNNATALWWFSDQILPRYLRARMPRLASVAKSFQTVPISETWKSTYTPTS